MLEKYLYRERSSIEEKNKFLIVYTIILILSIDFISPLPKNFKAKRSVQSGNLRLHKLKNVTFLLIFIAWSTTGSMKLSHVNQLVLSIKQYTKASLFDI